MNHKKELLGSLWVYSLIPIRSGFRVVALIACMQAHPNPNAPRIDSTQARQGPKPWSPACLSAVSRPSPHAPRACLAPSSGFVGRPTEPMFTGFRVQGLCLITGLPFPPL